MVKPEVVFRTDKIKFPDRKSRPEMMIRKSPTSKNNSPQAFPLVDAYEYSSVEVYIKGEQSVNQNQSNLPAQQAIAQTILI